MSLLIKSRENTYLLTYLFECRTENWPRMRAHTSVLADIERASVRARQSTVYTKQGKHI